MIGDGAGEGDAEDVTPAATMAPFPTELGSRVSEGGWTQSPPPPSPAPFLQSLRAAWQTAARSSAAGAVHPAIEQGVSTLAGGVALASGGHAAAAAASRWGHVQTGRESRQPSQEQLAEFFYRAQDLHPNSEVLRRPTPHPPAWTWAGPAELSDAERLVMLSPERLELQRTREPEGTGEPEFTSWSTLRASRRPLRPPLARQRTSKAG
jgi:hypothetical protein